MNRVERISAILIHLQSKQIVRGQDIAERFGISLRTAYRDIRALEEAGVPIVGEAGTGYSLMEGYKLPPVMFTKEEAIAFLTAEKLVEKFTDSSTYSIYQSALFKIKAVLKTDDKDHIDHMDNFIEVLSNSYLPHEKENKDFLQLILRSINLRKKISMEYFAIHSQENSTREIEPVGVYLMANEWYLIAFCLLRNDYRTFRVDRIKQLQLLQDDFSKEHPDLKTYLKQVVKEKKNLHEIVILVKTEKMKFFGNQKYYNGFVSQKELNDETEMTFLCSSLEGFARWYMVFGDHARIVSPKVLRKRVKELAKEVLKNLKV
jgi:predicted DNA-binding transcriptional regulator YafY